MTFPVQAKLESCLSTASWNSNLVCNIITHSIRKKITTMHYYFTWSNIFVPEVMIRVFKNLLSSLLKKFFHLVVFALPFPLCILFEGQIAVIEIIWYPSCYRLKNVWYRKTIFVFLVPPIKWTGIQSVAISTLTLYTLRMPIGSQCHSFVNIWWISTNLCHKDLLIEVIKLWPSPIKDMVDHSCKVLVLFWDANGMKDSFHMKPCTKSCEISCSLGVYLT